MRQYVSVVLSKKEFMVMCYMTALEILYHIESHSGRFQELGHGISESHYFVHHII